ncbi:MAG: chemotaxis protein CheW [Myxococcales bacterium]
MATHHEHSIDDEALREFINESREHLADMEASLLSIEAAGADIDVELVNKVFRAAHSIKGGSAFFGFNKTKELAHKAETVLDMLRSGAMVPNGEVVNLLLAAFDRLGQMVDDPARSEAADISDLVGGLGALASSYKGDRTPALAAPPAPPQPAAPVLPAPVTSPATSEAPSDRYVYELNLDLVHDLEMEGKSLEGFCANLEEHGEVHHCSLDHAAVGPLDAPGPMRVPVRVVYSSVLAPDQAIDRIDLPRDRMRLTRAPASSATGADRPVEAAPEPAATPVPAPVYPAPTEPEVAAPTVASPSVAAPVVVAPAVAAAVAPAAPPSEEPAAPAKPQPAVAARSGVEETLRVDVGLLENLMNLTGELVLSRNQLRAAVAQRDTQALSLAEQRLDQVTAQIQDVTMETRLQPLGTLFGRVPRLVRDLSQSLGKEIAVDLRGKDVALDRSIIEGLSDPLTHLVRNAVDHGIELPAERLKAGKPAAGNLRIEGRHEAGQVVLEIEDDGKGIDVAKVSDVALRKGLVSAERLRGMSEQEKLALIFLPGLSTAAQVTDVSGRGVGMDVVRTNLDRLGGKIEIKSVVGKGTLLRVKLPLTLAIIPSLIVSIEGERFAIPQINVDELLRVRAKEVQKRIEVVGGTEVLLLRDRILPLVRFSDFLGIVPTYIDPVTKRREVDRRKALADRRSPRRSLDGKEPPVSAQEAAARERRSGVDRRDRADGALEIAVVTTGITTYALVVDSFHDTEEIVVKPLGRYLKGLSEYAGATILGDGKAALIIDVAGLAAKVELGAVSASARAVEHAETAERERLAALHSLITFRNAPDELCAAPLSIVQRIERVSPSQVEEAAGRRTIQYRGALLPVVALGDLAPIKPIGPVKELAIIVTSVHGHDVGLLGAMPVDVVETKAVADTSTHRRPGISGSTLLREQMALLVDVVELVDAAYPEWRRDAVPLEAVALVPQGGLGVLLAEDSDFFRGQVRRLLQENGYTVFEAPDGESAWQLLLDHLEEIRAVVTDIEMPNLDGLGLTRRIRAEARTAPLPVIALSSLAASEDVEKGSAAGVGDYLVKLDREGLLESLRKRTQQDS